MDDAVRAIGRFLWKLLVVVVLTLAAMGVVGLIGRLLLGLDYDDVATASSLGPVSAVRGRLFA